MGLSGGIDSSFCTMISVDAVGSEYVHTFMFPYKYTSEISLQNAMICAKKLGYNYKSIPIKEILLQFNKIFTSFYLKFLLKKFFKKIFKVALVEIF